MKKSIRKLIRSFAVFAFVGSSFILTAQNTIKGTVKDKDGNAVIGAAVAEKGSTNGALTGVDGKYELSFSKDQIVLLFRAVGFSEVEKTVSSTTGTLDVTMSASSTQLDQVVITGLGTSVKRSNAANSVDYIDSKQLTGIATQTTMDGALYGKFKGANITSNSGSPGGGMSVRLRGVTAVLGSKQPIYIVDGILLDNSTTGFGNNSVSAAAGGGNQSSNQDDASNRIADLDPEDIENIEILKGSSAAAIYGAKAANGVVIITTKKGKDGKPVIGFSQTFGISKATRLLGQRNWNAELIDTAFGASAEFEANGLRNYEEEVYGGNGNLSTTRVTLSGKKDNTSYFLGGTMLRQKGIVQNTGYDKNSIRANISQRFNKTITVDFTSNYVNSETDKGFFNNSNNNTTVGYALAFTYPWEDLSADGNGNYPVGGAGSNVLETTDRVINRENVNRFISGLKLSLNLMKKDNQLLKLSIFGGMDTYSLKTTSRFPRTLTYFGEGQALEGVNGVTVGGSGGNTNLNSNAILVHTYYGSNNKTFRTQLGLTQESTDYDVQRIISTDVNGSQTSLGQAAISNVTHVRNQFIDQGFFAQEEINLNDMIIATVGIRGDKSTRNGDINKYFFYPKANLAVNIPELLGVTTGDDSKFSTAKLRIAYGEAGLFATTNGKYTSYDPVVVDGSSGLISSNGRGNLDISPQRNKELELGADIGLFGNKVFLDITYYTRKSIDFLMRSDLPSSSGYNSTLTNAGDLVNKGWEIGLNVNTIQKENLNWNTGINFWKNTSKVTRLDVPQTTTGGFANSLGTFLIQEGESITQIVGSYDATACEDCDPDGDGLIVYGNSEPDFNMSMTNSVTFGDFDFSMLWHWKKGGEGINLSTLLYDLAGTTWDYDDTDLDPNGELTNSDYRINNFFAGSPIGFVESTSYLRMREIALYYRLPINSKSISKLQIGVSGRNLINIFSYNSYDPEVSNFGNDVLGNAVEVTPFPSSKTYNFHIKANF